MRIMKVGPLLIAALTLGILSLAACATQPEPDAFDPPGFFSGYWHGLTIFFALIGHLFDSSIRIYNFPNSGGWYDFGFFLGIGTLSGGGASAGRGSDDEDEPNAAQRPNK
jgi:hypothetical protein